MKDNLKAMYWILRAGMILFMLVVPLAFFRTPLQKMGMALAGNDRLMDFMWAQSYPRYMMRANPGSRIRSFFFDGQGASGRKGETEVLDPDPAYREYVRNQRFLEAHPYIREQLEASSELPVIGREYAKEQLADYDFLMKTFYSVHASTTAGREMMEAERFLEKDFSLETDGEGKEEPQILIYHTHGSETYADYGENPNADIVHVGAYLAELLQKKGYGVIHDTSRYDMYGGDLDRNQAYTYSLDGVTKILQEHPSVEVLLDLHRDGVGENVRLVSEVNGKPTAQVMFFNGTSRTPEGPIEHLPNQNLEENLAFSFQMKLYAEAYFPGFTRKIYLKGLRYNLHLRGRSALIEVGAQNNTYEEAKNAMEPLAELLDMVLRGR